MPRTTNVAASHDRRTSPSTPTSSKWPLVSSDPKPHFGFVLVGGVYTRTITITNFDPCRSVRLMVRPPRSSGLHISPSSPHHNKLRLFTRDLVKLAPGMSIYIDLILFAAETAKFHDSFEIRLATGSMVIGVGAYILNQANWVCISKRLWLEKRPPVRPGVACLGTIERGKRKHLFANDFPEETRQLGQRHLKTTDRDHRPKRDRPIATIFPEEIEIRSSTPPQDDNNHKHGERLGTSCPSSPSAAPRVQMLQQLRSEELEELRLMPSLSCGYWDLRQQRLKLAPLLAACPVDKDMTRDEQQHRLQQEEVCENTRLERKGYLSARLVAMLKAGEVLHCPGVDGEEEGEEEEGEEEHGGVDEGERRAAAQAQGQRLQEAIGTARQQKKVGAAPGGGSSASSPRRDSVSPVNNDVSLTLLHRLQSGAASNSPFHAAMQQAMGGGGGGGGVMVNNNRAAPPSPYPAVSAYGSHGGGGGQDANHHHHAAAAAAASPANKPVTGGGGGLMLSRGDSFGEEFFDSPRFGPSPHQQHQRAGIGGSGYDDDDDDDGDDRGPFKGEGVMKSNNKLSPSSSLPPPPLLSLTKPNAVPSQYSMEDDDHLSDEWDGTKTGAWILPTRP